METSDQTQDLYEILDVPKTADATEIKRAYRRLAMKYHPDKNQDPQAAEMFKKINHAYDILSNPQKRRIYDAYGEDGLNGTPNGTPMSSLFPGFFGQQRPVYRYKCQITLEQYFRDKQIKLDFPRSIMCENCSGTGFQDKQAHFCRHCKGSGFVFTVIQQGHILQQVQKVCKMCNGQKIDLLARDMFCHNCQGKGTLQEVEHLTVPVPDNIIGTPYTVLEGRGPWANGRYIDLIVIFELIMTSNFTLLETGQLSYTLHLDLVETLCGFQRVFEHPSGRKILVILEPGKILNPQNIYLLPGLGLNHTDLLLSFKVEYPEEIRMFDKKFSIETLEEAFGPRKIPTATNTDISPENIFWIKDLQKYDPTSIPEYSEMPGHTTGERVECVQQ
jgi:DnaJ-class molecular chaperone